MTEEPIKVFFSYSHQDEEFKDELVKHLTILQRQGVISGWHDRLISPGAEWDQEIDTYLNSADIILLMVSSDFLASNYCWGVEVQQAMQRHEAGEACVIPVVLRWVDWNDAPFAKLQALPKNAKPIKSWEDQDEAFANTVQGIRKAARTVQAQKQQRVKQQGVSHELISVHPSNGEVPVEAPGFRESKQEPTPFSSPISTHKNLKLLGLTGSAVLVVGFVFYLIPKPQPQLPSQPSESPTVLSGSQMSAEDLFNQALEKQKREDKQGALSDYDQVIKLKPDHSAAYNNRGLVRSALGDKQGAIADYSRAIELKPDEAALAYNNRGNAHLDLGNAQGAIADYQKAADLYRQHGNAEEHQNALNRIKQLQK